MINWWLASADAVFPCDDTSRKFITTIEQTDVTTRSKRLGLLHMVNVLRLATHTDGIKWLAHINNTAKKSGGIVTATCIECVEAPRTAADIATLNRRTPQP